MEGFFEIFGKIGDYIWKNIGLFVLMCAVGYGSSIYTQYQTNIKIKQLERQIEDQERYTNKCVNHVMDFVATLHISEEMKK